MAFARIEPNVRRVPPFVNDQAAALPCVLPSSTQGMAALDDLIVSDNLRFVVTYQASRQLDALGDPTRRAIFERLARGPLAVVEIARALPVSRPAVSQHLKVLKDAGLVADRTEGTRRIYQLDRKGLAAVRDYFDKFWTEALDAFKRAVEEAPTNGKSTPRQNRSPKERRK
jgi:DNA-binding transcriptional ArsR family regulator